MSDRTQDLKNLRAVATACKNYVDETKEQILWQVGQYNITTQDDNTTAYQKVVPSGATRCKIKRIYGLTQKLNPTTASDSTSYSVKTMPATVYDFDISKVEGNSEKSENLVLEQKQIVLNAGSERWVNFGITGLIVGESYTLKNFTTTQSNEVWQNQSYGYANFTTTPSRFTATSSTLVFRVGTNTLNENINYQSKIMLVKGSTAPTEYKAGYTGIHNYEWNGVKVEGSNLFDNANATYSSSDNWDIITDFYLEAGKTYTIWTNENEHGLFTTGVAGWHSVKNTSATITPTQSGYLMFGMAGYNWYIHLNDFKQLKIMLNYGSTAQDYTPYIAPTTTTINLSSILYNGSPLFEGNSLKGYGGVNDELTPYKATKRKLFITLNKTDYTWTPNSNSTLYYCDYNFGVKDEHITGTDDNDIVNNILCDKLSTCSANDLYNGVITSGICINNASASNFYRKIGISASDYANLTTLNVIVDLATPIEVSIDWSSTLRGITGYNNGTITLVNTNNQDTANLITYNSIIKENCCAKMVQSRGGNVVKTINLPTQASDGWSTDSVYNYRDYTTNKRGTNVDKESNLQSVNFVGANGFFQSLFSRAKPPANNNTTATWLLSRIYEPDSAANIYNNIHDKRVGINSDNNYIQTRDNSYKDKDTFRLAMTNEPLYYELKDSLKTETDITEIENIIEVEPNDILSFYNSDDELVTIPSDLTYRIEVAK